MTLYFAGLSADTQLGMGCKEYRTGFCFKRFALISIFEKATHLDFHMVICTEEQGDRIPLLTAFIYGSVNGGLKDIVYRTSALIPFAI